MKFTSYGAAREVTGSKHMIEIGGKKVLFDCGMFQGRRKEAEEKNRNFQFIPSEIDAVVLSHAHIDHSGSLPNLVKQGYKGAIHCTPATHDLCNHMLMDSAYIQERESEYLNEKNRKQGDELIEPIYTQEDATLALEYFKEQKYNEPFEPVPGMKITFREAGHILGAAMLEIEAEGKKIIFTGDLGRKDLPVLRDPYKPENADILITESTYGNRLHESVVEAEDKLGDIINRTIKKGGKVIIPAFALERTQEIVYAIHKLVKSGRVSEDLPVYVDSPLAVNVTEVFRKHKEAYDIETNKIFADNEEDPFGFSMLRYITKVEESKALNHHVGPCIIISASGMCEFGRINHHLKNNIEDHRNTVLIVGYMAENTLGRKILNKEGEVKIFGKPYRLNAEVEVIDSYSGHADRSDLLSFATHLKGLKKIFIVHGEEKAQMEYKKALQQNGFTDIQIPQPGETFEI
ncbi:MBL fold metallo-hydrolase [Candidatus Peregrinibacteria bacterium CG22_combo_CG10-13_8_21_14_all_44_10]|nr:MAG: MBL fold metallo-hydrolase [Candidatus Peregrinibacteria bacterium CG2_30_44_17]PIP66744.1 MAG: MBL fold metallo-hydrolase [Candidatus Peregrinibacteria bacterium CG22_combo_CG10-13_8_21_14_all_44_10]PIS03951.1 MAG: MBL fold metallo-hydrolase [Candidatus Peregrinibacteria bacterium CG10_big_fil_rev_8_21_14_0_10_44_7]PIX80410.1 MAG: MBL fold metallo-hydrolase [Candidatus Peregrinibacteria bacterium CG_4_10_14_3_um_filter_44_21]PJB89664.1 MAG: MBL fold metallo-hydrolase [Candidatus Peregr